MASMGMDRLITLGGNAEQIFKHAGVTASGLSSEEARERLERMGGNVIPEDEKISVWELVLDQLKSPLIYVLLIAALVTLALRDYKDTAVILAVVILNGVIGFIQEYKANVAIQALQQLTSSTSRVRRDGKVQRIDSRELVPGDIVLLQSGDKVDADCRLVSARELRTDESMLTGESLPVEKSAAGLADTDATMADWVNIGFAGTLVLEGSGEAVVVATGSDMELGKIAEQVKGEHRISTPLQENIKKLSHYIALITLGLCAVVMALGLARGMKLLDLFLVAIALAVSAIPEGLPVVVTITLAIGVRRMAKHSVIIRKLAAVETLGSTEVIGSDKTGTLTQNRMTANSLYFGPWKLERAEGVALDQAPLEGGDGSTVADSASASQARERMARIGALCNASHLTISNGEVVEREGSPTELAILEMAVALSPGMYEQAVNRSPVDEVPFNSERKFMASVHQTSDGGLEMLAKGSPEAIISRSANHWTADGEAPLDKEHWLRTADEMAARGQRVLALARRDWDSRGDGFDAESVQGLTLMGLVGLIDPARPDAASAVEGCRESGIRVIMITGDHAVTARAIAIDLGIIKHEGDLPPIEADPRVITGRELDSMSDETLIERLEEVRVFARVTPQDKHRLVRLIREQGKVIAVTGDGVNDAPALKTAHLGVAMGKSGTEVAKQASDMVLLNDSFAAIYEAVKEGRYVFENIKKVSFFLVSSGVGEVLAILTALAMAWPLPYTAVQILWINLATNGLQDVALAFEPGEERLACRKPRGLREGIFDRTVIQHTIGIMFLFAIGTLALFKWAGGGDNLKEARTVAMTTMVMFQMWHVFNCRSMDTSVFRIPLFSNRYLIVSVLGALAAQITVLYWGPAQSVFGTTALNFEHWTVILAVTAPVILLMEASKWLARRRSGPCSA